MYPLWKRHQRFLIALFSAVDMDNRLVRLRGENVRAGHCNAIWRSCALLEDMSLRDQWLELVDEDAGILGDACIRLGRGRNGGHELFGEHGRAWFVEVGLVARLKVGSSRNFGGARESRLYW